MKKIKLLVCGSLMTICMTGCDVSTEHVDSYNEQHKEVDVVGNFMDQEDVMQPISYEMDVYHTKFGPLKSSNPDDNMYYYDTVFEVRMVDHSSKTSDCGDVIYGVQIYVETKDENVEDGYIGVYTMTAKDSEDESNLKDVQVNKVIYDVSQKYLDDAKLVEQYIEENNAEELFKIIENISNVVSYKSDVNTSYDEYKKDMKNTVFTE